MTKREFVVERPRGPIVLCSRIGSGLSSRDGYQRRLSDNIVRRGSPRWLRDGDGLGLDRLTLRTASERELLLLVRHNPIDNESSVSRSPYLIK